MTDYTPTTVTVADVYATATGLPEAPQRCAWFYRWFDTEIQAAEQRGQQLGQAKGWDEGYNAGVDDERTSESNIGIAGFGMKVEPARNNPYRADQLEDDE